MSHYFTNDSSLKSDLQSFEFLYRDQKLKFFTDSGVFSKTFIDFGSQVMLNNLIVDDSDMRLLDVGCGYGAMGLTLAKTYPHLDLEMVDVNQKALELCKQNAKNNAIDNVNIYESNVYEKVETLFDIVITNPPIRAGKEVVHNILEGAFDKLNSNGELWVVIQKKQGAPSAQKKMELVFGNCEVVAKEKGYFILKSIKKTGL